MKFSSEQNALVWALMASVISLGGALLAARPIQMIANLSSPPAETSSADAQAEIVTSPELAAQGQEFFAMSCSECHGDDAHGDEGPDLHNLAISNARIAKTIKGGIKGEMPKFAKKYGDKEIAALVSYLRTLR